jgi:hypothetical protein
MNKTETSGGFTVTLLAGNQELVLSGPISGPFLNVSIREAFPEMSDHSLRMIARALAECYLAGRRDKMSQIKTALETP